MKSLLLKTTCFVLAISVSIPTVGYAAELRLAASKVEVRDGDELMVSAILYADEVVNAVEGQISFPDDLFVVQEIRDGNSSINFWIEEPHVESPGVIVYSGITPGGFSGVNNVLFSIVFTAKATGIAQVAPEETIILQNDGAGNELAVTLRSVDIGIREESGSNKNETTEDTEAPEAFAPTVAQDPSMFDGDYFLVFATQDKGSGIKHYKVREGRFDWWREVESPYLLLHQRLDRDIYVRAVDNAGNEWVAVAPATVHSSLWERYGLLAILMMLVILVRSYKKAWIRFIK